LNESINLWREIIDGVSAGDLLAEWRAIDGVSAGDLLAEWRAIDWIGLPIYDR